MMSTFRTQSRPATMGALVVALCLFSGSRADAQQQDPSLNISTTPVTNAAAPPPQGGTSAGYWELIGGFEADTHGSAYAFFGPGYVNPIRDNLAWTARVFGNYLAYEFTDANGENEVSSPGVSGTLGLRFGSSSWFGVNAGPEVKWRKTEITHANGTTTESSETKFGANIGAEAYMNPTSHNNLHAIVNYGTVDKYTWARLGFKEKVGNRGGQGSTSTYLGVEGIAQGNEDIRSTQFGGFFEINPTNLSLMFRAGYKRSTFDVGPNKTGLYFGVGYYQRLD